ncbi:MAG: GNAT family N-acetyltransferase [Candidatus Babeliaceae bacterium]
MKIFKSISILHILLVSFSISAMGPIIERYNKARDGEAIQKILKDNYETLTYEFLGQPEGTTNKYLESSKFITDVIRIDGKTIGFVNYIAYNGTFCTFHIGRYGMIHLIGIDTDYQHNGYGEMLLDHALATLKQENTPIIFLAVKTDNVKARSLYEKKNFSCNLPPAAQSHTPQLFYSLTVEVPADQLPQGNFVQRYPKTCLGITIIGIGAYMYATHWLKSALHV